MRLIDADELLTAFPLDDEPILKKSCVRMTIKHMPTIEAEPIRHGHWIGHKYYECSICGAKHDIDWYYCPTCGAKMDAPTQKSVGEVLEALDVARERIKEDEYNTR